MKEKISPVPSTMENIKTGIFAFVRPLLRSPRGGRLGSWANHLLLSFYGDGMLP
jgi:hypothetical protein